MQGKLNTYHIKIPLLGDYQLENTATAVAALELLSYAGFTISATDISQGLARVEWPGRFQVLEREKGVCWAGFLNKKSIIVPDVHKFPDHIACDSRSKSEIVVPLLDQKGLAWGVLDVDSKAFDAFSPVDQHWLEKIVTLI